MNVQTKGYGLNFQYCSPMGKTRNAIYVSCEIWWVQGPTTSMASFIQICQHK